MKATHTFIQLHKVRESTTVYTRLEGTTIKVIRLKKKCMHCARLKSLTTYASFNFNGFYVGEACKNKMSLCMEFMNNVSKVNVIFV